MSDKEAENVFYRRVRLFAKVTFAAAILLVVVAIATGIARRAIQQSYGRETPGWVKTLDAERFGPVKEVIAFTYGVVNRTVRGALLACGVAIVALIVARMNVRGAPAALSFPLDERFEREAGRFAMVAQCYAWVYLVATAITILFDAVPAISRAVRWREAENQNLPSTLFSLTFYVDRSASVLLKFCMILLCALIVKGLVLLSKQAKGKVRVSVEGARDE